MGEIIELVGGVILAVMVFKLAFHAPDNDTWVGQVYERDTSK